MRPCILVALAMALLLSAPAGAQRDRMSLGESLGAVVVRPPAPPDHKDAINLDERLEQTKLPAAAPASPSAEGRKSQ